MLIFWEGFICCNIKHIYMYECYTKGHILARFISWNLKFSNGSTSLAGYLGPLFKSLLEKFLFSFTKKIERLELMVLFQAKHVKDFSLMHPSRTSNHGS